MSTMKLSGLFGIEKLPAVVGYSIFLLGVPASDPHRHKILYTGAPV